MVVFYNRPERDSVHFSRNCVALILENIIFLCSCPIYVSEDV